jgi:hypothetical protein
MNFNELTKHIKQLNELEQIKHEQRKQTALNRIRELRLKQKTNEKVHNPS